MNKINWQGYEWLTQERWGLIHPEKPLVWYDSSAVSIDIDQTLRLKARPNPKEFEIYDPECDYDCPPPKIKVTSPFGIGLVSCTEKFGYGYFEIEAKLPKGPYAWPAFWMWAFETYPPEIDVFEGYSNKKGSYFNWHHDLLLGKFWRVKSNIHLKDKTAGATIGGQNSDGTHRYQLNAKAHWLGWKSPHKKFNKYAVLWDKDLIEIYFNDKCVRRITDQKVLRQFDNRTMNVIINNSVQDGYSKNPLEHEMVIKNFKYKPK